MFIIISLIIKGNFWIKKTMQSFLVTETDYLHTEASQAKLHSKSPQKQKVHRDFKPLLLLNQSSFPVYLVYSEYYKKHLALKIYPYQGPNISPFYNHEVKLATLKHPNVISLIEKRAKKDAVYNGTSINFSYIVLELAPYGNFYQLLSSGKFPRDDILIRSYLHQLIEGLEYLHSNGVYHMDIKLSNLLIGENYLLKIAGFKCCQFGKEPSLGKGTKNFRAPEVKTQECINKEAADVYSAGIVLFVMKASMLPYIEDKPIKGYDMFKLLKKGEAFWDAHNDCQSKMIHCDEDFKELFNGMVKYEPSERYSIQDVKKSAWYNGPVYSKKEIKIIMHDRIKVPNILRKCNVNILDIFREEEA